MRLFLKQTSSMKILKASSLVLLCCLLYLSGTVACLERPRQGRHKEIDTETDTISRRFGKTYGDTPYKACSGCSTCQCCNGGDSPGICESNHNKKTTGSKTIANGTTCRAITKKGTRCKRSPRASGYCRQHER
jgi:hypothetical protein